MRILLIANIFSEGCTGIMALKALQYLGHEVDVWDTNISDKPPVKKYDFSLTWTNNLPDLKKIQSDKNILYYLDDPLFHGEKSAKHIANIDGYDEIFTCNLIPGFEKNWLPIGMDRDVHIPLNLPEIDKFDVAFIGTLRDDSRRKFVKKLSDSLGKNDINLFVWGNGWNGAEVRWLYGPVYFSAFNRVCNKARIIVNKHFDIAPSTKVHEICGCGGGLLLSDDKEAVKECYPGVPVFNSVRDCVSQIKEFLDNKKKRQEIVSALHQKSFEFSYMNQLRKILK